MTPEPRQAEFIARVEAYATGVFRGTFNDTGDLLGKLEQALATAAVSIQPMRPRPLTGPIAVPWRADERRFSGSGVVLETHVIPVGPVDRLPATTLRELPTRLARAGRDHGLFREGQALNLGAVEHAAVAQTDQGDRADSGAAISAKRAVTIWSALPTQQLGAVTTRRRSPIRSRATSGSPRVLRLGLQRMRRSPWALGRSTCSAG